MKMKRSIDSPQSLHRHVPQRTCVACRQVKPKRELIRVVCTPAGAIEIDGGGKKSGRGAYLCKAWECWETGLNSDRLEHTLRSSLHQDDREKLKEQARDLIEGAD